MAQGSWITIVDPAYQFVLNGQAYDGELLPDYLRESGAPELGLRVKHGAQIRMLAAWLELASSVVVAVSLAQNSNNRAAYVAGSTGALLVALGVDYWQGYLRIDSAVDEFNVRIAYQMKLGF
jgi:hypothetical protein